MAKTEFQLEDLRDALASEKASKQLCDMSDEFYKGMRRYLQDLREEVEEVDIAAGSRATRLQRQFRRAIKFREDLFNRRVQKIVRDAVHKLGGEKPDMENMTSQEKKLYHEVVGQLEETQGNIFKGRYEREPSSGIKEGKRKDKKGHKRKEQKGKRVRTKPDRDEGSGGTEVDMEREDNEIEKDIGRGIEKEEKGEVKGVKTGRKKGSSPEGVEAGPEVHEELEEERDTPDELEPEPDGSEEETNDEKKTEIHTETTGGTEQKEILIRVTDKVKPFVDMHGSYDLEEEDVVTLKKDIADLLVKQGKAEKIRLD